MPRETRAQVVLVEDHPMFREQLAHLINKQPDMAVCAEADNATEGFAVIRRQQPVLAIIDITLKGSSGLELLKDLRAQGMVVIDFAEIPDHFRCPDGSHLEASEADRFSRLLGETLAARGFFR